ncbi:uncharacterized protein LOC128740196 [Sabethes cyaneus]|uniref:uncharacterized protein LOC128740196 n=1 Tax=Sabethes cyaneus TaxID=53552 RepID=UPI00237E2EDF|nr:uncharacterized protein LOC128740196 [Sabethes cyaneus]
MAHGIGSDLEISSLLEVSVIRSACPLCDGPDDGKMVNCDKCHQWFHFECVGVNESESERDWSCVQCSAQVPTGPSTSDSIQDLRKQIDLLERKLAATQVKENQRVRCDVDPRPIRGMFGAKSTGAIPKANSTAIGTVVSSGGSKTSFENDDDLEDELRLLEEKHALEKRQLQERYAVLQKRRSSTGINQTGTQAELGSSNSSFCNELSRSQLAARQAVSRDLPAFYGHPEEWPLFYASFESSTRMCGYSDEENLLRLQRSLKGKALDAVRSRLLHPSNLPGIMSTLKTLFGRPEMIVHSLVARIRDMPSPRAEKLNTLIDFGIAVQNVCATIKACGLDEYLCNVALLQELVERLPPTIKLNWALYRQTLSMVTLSSYGDWLEKLVEAACVVTTVPVETSINKKNRKQDDYVNVHSEETVSFKPSRTRTDSKRCVICEGTCSSSEVCETFRGMSVSSRWCTLREKKLCKKCLNKHFGACNVRSSCGKNGCTFMHHPMLHDDVRYKATDPRKQPSSQSCNAHSGPTGNVLFRYIPVILHGKNVTVKTHAFLDDGSSATFMEHSLLKELQLEGTPNPLCLNWTGGQQREERESVRLQLEISGGSRNRCKKYVLPKVHTVRTLALPSQSVAIPDLSSRYQYLQGLPICSYDSVSPRLLIGIDNCHVGHALKSKEGAANEPVAEKTRLGWLVYGPCSVTLESSARNFNACHSFHICSCSGDTDSDLNTALKEYFSIDSLGILRPAKPLLSKDNERATQLLLSRTHLTNNRYETGLLWRSDEIHLPDSKAMAEKRLVCLERRMSRDQLLAKTLQEKISEYKQKGYIRKLSPEEVAAKHPRKWYLPVFHHNVYVPVLRFERFSKWKRLIRATAYALRYISYLRRKSRAPLNATPLSKEELQQAEWCIFRQVQKQAFPEEYNHLYNSADMKSNRTLPKNSKLYKLNPYIDNTGILRMQSRIQLCQFVNDCAKYPILLPKRHYLTDLVIADYHCHYKHINHETVINQIRQKFHIPQLRSAHKRVRNSCQVCKIQRAEPHAPMMADLPVARMAAFTRPFSYTGIDYFGPISVVVGRRTEKRWGVLMTCLTVRAIHIEIAYSLSTDSCILALRNFVARREPPVEIFSDRGTNFIGASRVLRKELEKVDQDKIMEYFVDPNTKWTFNPPAAPHFGGSWERLIQSVKKVLNQVKPKRLPTDELLRTMLSEVELIVNSRPLTHIPLDVDSLPPLTPNDILLGSSNGSKPPIAFNDSPDCLKNSWKASQCYADEFWNRFVIEYLPTLTRRSKWFQRTRPIEVGDVALIVDKNLPRNCWPKGRVVEVVRSKDQQVRRATLETAQGRMERPAVNIAILDVGSNSSKSDEGHNLLGGNVTLSVTEPPSASSLGDTNSAKADRSDALFLHSTASDYCRSETI